MKQIRLAETLRALRKSHNYTQKQVSDYLNISRQAYSNYENNKRTPELDMLLKIITFYQISFDQLLVGHDIVAMEEKGPYYTGLEVKSGETIYLAEREKNLLTNFRTLDTDTKLIVEGFIENEKNKLLKE